MTRSDLNARMAKRSPLLAAKDAEIAVNAILDAMISSLASGQAPRSCANCLMVPSIQMSSPPAHRAAGISLIVKKLIDADFRKNNSVAISVNADCRPFGCARLAPPERASGHNGAPMKHTALPCPTSTSDRLAAIKAQEATKPFVTLDCGTSQPKTTAVSVASYF